MNGRELRNGLDEFPIGDTIVSSFVGKSKKA